MLGRVMIIAVMFVGLMGNVAAYDGSDTDAIDTTAQEVKIKPRLPENTNSNVYNVGRSNLRINKNQDDYNWNTAGDDEDAAPLGTSYGVEW